MKRLLFLFATILCWGGNVVYGQTKEKKSEGDGFVWYLVKNGDKVGAEDINGNILLHAIYDDITYEWKNRSGAKFKSASFIAKEKNRFRAFAPNGTLILYAYVDNLQIVQDEGHLFYQVSRQQGGKTLMGMLDKYGEEIFFIEVQDNVTGVAYWFSKGHQEEKGLGFVRNDGSSILFNDAIFLMDSNDKVYIKNTDGSKTYLSYVANDPSYSYKSSHTTTTPFPFSKISLYLTVENDKFGFCDKMGKIVLPCIWEEARGFSDGMAAVKKKGRWGFINEKGEQKVPFIWKEVHGFSEGLALVVDENNQYGYIDKEGKIVVSCQYSSLSNDFYEGVAVVKKKGYYGVIDKKGKEIIPCEHKRIGFRFSGGLASIENRSMQQGVVSKTGKMIIPFNSDAGLGGYYVSEGLALVEKKGFMDSTGKIVIPWKWKSARGFSEGLAWVTNDSGDMGCIDKSGKLVIAYKKWKWASDFNEGLARVQDINGKWGFIDKTGKNVVPCIWESAQNFSEGLAIVKDKDNSKYGAVDKAGKLVIPCTWYSVSTERQGFKDGLACVLSGSGIQTTGKYLINMAGQVVKTIK